MPVDWQDLGRHRRTWGQDAAWRGGSISLGKPQGQQRGVG